MRVVTIFGIASHRKSRGIEKQDAAELEQLQRDIDSLDTVKPPVAQEPQAPDTICLKQDTPGVDTSQSPSEDAPQSGRIQESSTDTSKDNITPAEDSFKRDSTGLYTSSVFSISPRSVIQLGR